MQSSDTLQSRKKRWHFSVEKDFVCDAKLSPMARMLYLVLMSYASPTSPVPFPGMRTLSTILQCTEDTVRKYRVELEQADWLEVERRRDGYQKFLSNAYILLDGPEDAGAMPKKPDTAFSRNGENPDRVKPDTKRVPVDQEKTIAKRRETSSSNTAPAATGAAAAAEASPSAPTGAEAPEPPSAVSKAETFVQGFMQWGQYAGLSVSVIPRERQAVAEFFTSNPHFSARELLAIAVLAWQMPSTQMQDSNHQLFWHCNLKSKRIKTFMEFLPAIQDEMTWEGNPSKIEKVFQKAEVHFQQRAAA